LALESLKGPEGPLQAIRTLSALKAVACHVFLVHLFLFVGPEENIITSKTTNKNKKTKPNTKKLINKN
jgi:hypothetical protein